MNEVRIKTEKLINWLVEDIIYQNHDTWTNRLNLMETGLEIITDINTQESISNEDKVIVKNVIEELIKLNINQKIEVKNYKHKKISEISKQLKEESSKISCKEIIEPIETFDDWIKSLKIFKLNGIYLNSNYYENSYELYNDIRKIVLRESSNKHQQIYALRLSEKLLEQNNQKTLPPGITLEKGDYELSEIIRLINNNPQYHYRLKKSLLYNEINYKFDRKEHANKLYLLLKQPENR